MTKKILIFILTLLTDLCIGLVYGWSVFVAPLEAEFGWERSATSLTFTISIMAMCIGIMAGGWFNNHKSRPFVSMIIAAVLMFIGFAVVSRAHTLIIFYIFYGVFCGFGVGFAYVMTIAATAKWFPGRQGFISGCIMMCFGLGGMVLGTTCSSLMGVIGWRPLFLALGLVFGGVLLLDGIGLQRVCKDDRADDAKTNADDAKASATDDDGSITSAEMIKSPDFVVLYIWHMTMSAAGLALVGHIAPCAMQIGATAVVAAFLAGIVSVSNGVGRIVYGILYDLLGVKKNMILISCVFLIASVIAAVAVSVGSIPVLIVGCILVGMSFGACPTSSSAVVNRFYGPKYFSSNFGIISTQLMFAALIGPFAAGKLYTATGSYVTTFYGIIGLGILAIVLAFAVIRLAGKKNRKLDR